MDDASTLDLDRRSKEDALAFTALYKNNIRELMRVARRIVRDRAPDLAEDIVQKVLFRTWRQRDALDYGSDLLAYLQLAVYREAHAQLLRRDFIRDTDACAELGYATDPTDLEPEAAMVRYDLVRLIRDAIEELPQRRAEIFRLWLYAGLTYGEIGRQLSITRARVNKVVTEVIESFRVTLVPVLRTALDDRRLRYRDPGVIWASLFSHIPRPP